LDDEGIPADVYTRLKIRFDDSADITQFRLWTYRHNLPGLLTAMCYLLSAARFRLPVCAFIYEPTSMTYLLGIVLFFSNTMHFVAAVSPLLLLCAYLLQFLRPLSYDLFMTPSNSN
jgi:hypothetical protein